VAALLSRLEAALTDVAVPLDKQDIVGWIGEVVPEFRHVETGRSLDDRM
jgi:hypothetical protein